jgi:DNA helicase-2/ATP-dependent DNA helicase PcrA
MTGKIDRVDKLSDGKLEIIDYKTGRMPDEKELKKSLQLSIYAMAASDEGLYNHPIDKVALTFYYLQDMNKVTMNRTTEELMEVRTKIKSSIEEMKKGEYKPKVGIWCDFCPFKMICEAWQ